MRYHKGVRWPCISLNIVAPPDTDSVDSGSADSDVTVDTDVPPDTGAFGDPWPDDTAPQKAFD